MSRKDNKAIIILLLALLVIGVIIVVRFFTKDRINKSTAAEVEAYEEYEEDAFLDETISEEIEEKNVENEDIAIESASDVAKVNEDIVANDSSSETNNTNQNSTSISSRLQGSRNVEVSNSTTQSSSTEIASVYQGYATVGKIEIPQTGVNLYILSNQTVGGMEIAACQIFTTGKLNENGNTLIVGHNYKNGKLFSKNNSLTVGDKIYITTLDGNKIEYVIYDKFVTTPEDASFLDRDTNGKPEITLSTCSDDGESRIVILARAN